MEDIKEIINFIFYDLIKKFELKIIESDKQSILYQNKVCYLFVGHHMGETYVHIKKERNGTIILPFMWAITTNKLDYKQTLPINIFDPNTKSIEFLKYSLTVEKTLISLFCIDLLNGDFSNLKNYEQNIELKNKVIYEYYNKD